MAAFSYCPAVLCSPTVSQLVTPTLAPVRRKYHSDAALVSSYSSKTVCRPEMLGSATATEE